MCWRRCARPSSCTARARADVFPVVREPLETGGVFGIKSGIVRRRAPRLQGRRVLARNRARGGEPHQATILLIDPATGRPLCLIDGNAVTTVRTGAAGALGLQHLARPDSTRLCVFGTGVQARIQLSLALDLLPTLREVRYVTSAGSPSRLRGGVRGALHVASCGGCGRGGRGQRHRHHGDARRRCAVRHRSRAARHTHQRCGHGHEGQARAAGRPADPRAGVRR